jgi:hypothetical protein
MASANQAYAVNSQPVVAAKTAKSTAEGAMGSMGEEIADVAGDVSAMASNQ